MNKILEVLKKQRDEKRSKLTEPQTQRQRDVLERQIAKLEQQIEREESKAEVDDAKACDRESAVARAAAEQWLAERAIWYVQKQDCYIMRLQSGVLETFTKESMQTRYWQWEDKMFRLQMSALLEERGAKFHRMTYDFNGVDSDHLNLMEKQHWLMPLDDGVTHHWAFDCLMVSLGGGKSENIDHLEHVIAYKYLHPEDFMIPAMVVFGEGRVGKNLLVDEVLSRIYGDHQVISAMASDIIGDFNSSVKGRTIALINEAIAEKTDMETLKDLVYKRYVNMNEKYIAPYRIANTPHYWLGGNSMDSAVMLGNDESDQRWSIIKVERAETLVYWIAFVQNWSEPQAREWLRDNCDAVFRNETEIARWLNALIQKHGQRPRPSELHGQDYQALVHHQKKFDVRVAEAVFNDPGFECIERKVLYAGYKWLLNEYGNKKYQLSDQKFYARIEDWIGIHAPHISKASRNWGGARSTHHIWLNSNVGNAGRYDTKADYIGDLVWVGPDLS